MDQKISDQTSEAQIRKIEKIQISNLPAFRHKQPIQFKSAQVGPNRLCCLAGKFKIYAPPNVSFIFQPTVGVAIYGIEKSREFNYELISQVGSELNRDSPKQRRRNGAEIRGLGQYDVIKSKNNHNGVQNIYKVAGDYSFLCTRQRVHKIIQTNINRYIL